ncbi:unnamed protein product [Chrysodeixis includens]|uniref:Uncharacterized protein n=1 Tax=Chrysodeixis includens TaxID=689277 RepID=A0A9N8Q1S5_CHRIL|nr:unnamed protein product [Chrysodeixis includens]
MSSGVTLRQTSERSIRHAGHGGLAKHVPRRVSPAPRPHRAAPSQTGPRRVARCRAVSRRDFSNFARLATSEQFIFIDRRETSIAVRKVKNQSLYKKSTKVWLPAGAADAGQRAGCGVRDGGGGRQATLLGDLPDCVAGRRDGLGIAGVPGLRGSGKWSVAGQYRLLRRRQKARCAADRPPRVNHPATAAAAAPPGAAPSLRHIHNRLVISHCYICIRNAARTLARLRPARGATVRVRFPDMINVFVIYSLALARSVPVGFTVQIM